MSNPPTIPPRFTYPKAEHLKSRKAIEQLFKTGQSFFIYPYKVVYQFVSLQSAVDSRQVVAVELQNDLIKESNILPETQDGQKSDCRLPTADCPLLSGFAASTRNFKHAVDRNRIKRLGKEAYRLNKHALIHQLAINQLKMEVFFIFTDKKLPNWKLIEPKMQACLKKLIHLTKKHHEKLLQG